MKIILVIQSIIIIAGAIYIFTLHQSTAPSTGSFEEVMIPPPPPPPPPAPEAVAPEVPATDIAGPNDAGMEWPTIEGGIEAQ